MGERGTGVDGVDGVDEEASTPAHHLSMTFCRERDELHRNRTQAYHFSTQTKQVQESRTETLRSVLIAHVNVSHSMACMCSDICHMASLLAIENLTGGLVSEKEGDLCTNGSIVVVVVSVPQI